MIRNDYPVSLTLSQPPPARADSLAPWRSGVSRTGRRRQAIASQTGASNGKLLFGVRQRVGRVRPPALVRLELMTRRLRRARGFLGRGTAWRLAHVDEMSRAQNLGQLRFRVLERRPENVT